MKECPPCHLRESVPLHPVPKATSASPGVIHRAASAWVLLDSWHQGCKRIEQVEKFFQKNPPGRVVIQWKYLIPVKPDVPQL